MDGDRGQGEGGVKAWKNVPAIRERRVFVVRDELLNTPGPPLVAGARALWRVIRGVGRARASAE